MGSELGMRRPVGSIFYVTEVAVSPKTRRSGAGKLLMKVRLFVESLFHQKLTLNKIIPILTS